MKKRFVITATAIALAVGALVAPSAAAAGQAGQATITNVRTTAQFDYAAGDSLENLTLNPDGSVTVSVIGSQGGLFPNRRPELVRIGQSGKRTVLVTGPVGETITGNTRGHDGTIYFNVWSTDPSRMGVWRLPVGGVASRFAALPADAMPNGLAVDQSGRTLYVSDSFKSTVWSVPTSGGSATAWLVDPALGAPPKSMPPVGANGLRFHAGSVWVSNFAGGTLLRIPVTATGAPGPLHVVTSGLMGIDDFSFLSPSSNVVFAAVNPFSEIAVIYPDGTSKIVLTSADGLSTPTATAVRGNSLYITDGGFQQPHDAKVQVGTINLLALCAGGRS